MVGDGEEPPGTAGKSPPPDPSTVSEAAVSRSAGAVAAAADATEGSAAAIAGWIACRSDAGAAGTSSKEELMLGN